MKSPLELLVRRREKALQAWDAADSNLRRREAELSEHLAILYPDVGEHNFSISYYHECPNGSVGICVYDKIHDPNLDSCLACGQPEERK